MITSIGTFDDIDYICMYLIQGKPRVGYGKSGRASHKTHGLSSIKDSNIVLCTTCSYSSMLDIRSNMCNSGIT